MNSTDRLREMRTKGREAQKPENIVDMLFRGAPKGEKRDGRRDWPLFLFLSRHAAAALQSLVQSLRELCAGWVMISFIEDTIILQPNKLP